MTKFYVATNPTLIEKLERYHQQRIDACEYRRQVAKELGAEEVAHYTGKKWGIKTFREGFGGAAWKKMSAGYFVPKLNIKSGKEAHAKMRAKEAILPGGMELAEVIGFDPFADISNGILTPGLNQFTEEDGSKIWVLLIPSDFEPAGCERISDMEYEEKQQRVRVSNGRH